MLKVIQSTNIIITKHLIIDYINQRRNIHNIDRRESPPRDLSTSRVVIDDINTISNIISNRRNENLSDMDFNSIDPRITQIWIIEEIYPVNLDGRLVNNLGQNPRMWSTLRYVIRRALQESIGGTDTLRSQQIPTLVNLSLSVLYSDARYIRQVNITHPHGALQQLNQIRQNSVTYSRLPGYMPERSFATILDYAISGLLPPLSNDIWLRTTRLPESNLYNMNQEHLPYEDLHIPREFIRRTFVGYFLRDGRFRPLRRLLPDDSNERRRSMPHPIENPLLLA